MIVQLPPEMLPSPWPSPQEIQIGALGDTCPLLKIAAHYDAHYEMVLDIADAELYHRWPRFGMVLAGPIADDVHAAVSRLRLIRAGGIKWP